MPEATPTQKAPAFDQTKIITYAIGGAILYFGVLRPILKRTGIIQSQEDQKTEKTIQDNRAADTGNPWNPNYYKTSKDQKSWLPWKTATALATQIYDAKAPSSKNWFTDNENSAIAAFNGISTKKQLSLLSNAFQKLYTRDLYNFLESFMNNDQLAAVNGKTKNLK
jgi:hypothetical protein